MSQMTAEQLEEAMAAPAPAGPAQRRYVPARTADPRNPPPVPAEAEQHLNKLGVDAETLAYMKFLFPDPATETQAQQEARELEQAKRVERLRTLDELVRAAVAGDYGAVTRAAVRQVLADQSTPRTEQLEQCGRIIEKQRAADAKTKQATRGKYAP